HTRLDGARIGGLDLHPSDLFKLLPRDLAHLLLAGAGAARTLLLLEVQAGGLLEKDRGGRGLGDEAEGPVGVDRDDHRDDQVVLHLGLGRGVELLAELHDVHAVLTQRGADRRRRVRLPRGDLELDLPHDFLCHDSLLRGSSDREDPVSHSHCTFSTCMKSSSTGVALPKIDTSTRSRPFSGLTSSTEPLKPEKGPSITRTVSPVSNWTLGLGLSAPSVICEVR